MENNSKSKQYHNGSHLVYSCQYHVILIDSGIHDQNFGLKAI